MMIVTFHPAPTRAPGLAMIQISLVDSLEPVPEASTRVAAAAPVGYLGRIAVRVRNRIVIVPTADIRRVDAEGNYVRLSTDRTWLHKETLTGLCERLDPAEFLRVHRSHAVNLRYLRELEPMTHGEFRIRLVDGSELVSGRAYREAIRRALGLD
jgi:two-component system LytT family response regulator